MGRAAWWIISACESGSMQEKPRHFQPPIDFITHAEARAKFNHVGIENLYQEWQSGQMSFDQVRKEYSALRRPEAVTFTFSPVNGQAALFERHPKTLVKTARKSTRPGAFTGHFTSQFSGAER